MLWVPKLQMLRWLDLRAGNRDNSPSIGRQDYITLLATTAPFLIVKNPWRVRHYGPMYIYIYKYIYIMNSTAETAWETRRNCNVTIGVDPFRATFQ